MPTSTGPSPAGWMKNPLWPTRRPSSRTAPRPIAKEGSRPSSSERWPTSRSKQDWASWTAASPPTSLNPRPRTVNVYKDLQCITATAQLVFAGHFLQSKRVVWWSSVLQYIPYVLFFLNHKFFSWYLCLLFYVELCYKCTVFVRSLCDLLC